MKPSVHLQEILNGRRWIGLCTGGPDPGKYIRSGCGDFWVGRLPDAEFSFDHESVSVRHATLRVIDGSLFVNDEGSQNGTFVNNVAVKPGKPNWFHIRPPTSFLMFGSVEVKVLWVGAGLSPIRTEWLAWNDGTVVKLAATIHSEALFMDLPILADALEEAGCADPLVLTCCRQGEQSDTVDYLLELISGIECDPIVVHSRPMAPLLAVIGDGPSAHA